MSALTPIHDASGAQESPMHIFQIFLDGIDKTGKDLIRSYIFYLAKGRYICVARGIASMIVYSRVYDRPYQYDMSTQACCLNVLLEVEYDDWDVRCNIEHEPKINYLTETMMFREVFKELSSKGYHTLQFNTSKLTPYVIARQIIAYMEKINGIDK